RDQPRFDRARSGSVRLRQAPAVETALGRLGSSHLRLSRRTRAVTFHSMSLRADFHHHINTDPIDPFVRHSAGDLIDRAVTLGLNALAITCHESVPYDSDVVDYARERGVFLLRGMEATVNGGHVLLINFPEFPPGVCTVDDIKAAKAPDSLVISPHPFYPTSVAATETLMQHPDVFDAVEFSGLYTKLASRFNRRATAHAARAGLP